MSPPHFCLKVVCVHVIGAHTYTCMVFVFHPPNSIVVHTMDELKLTGNCLLGSRPLLSFDSVSGCLLHIQVMKSFFAGHMISL